MVVKQNVSFLDRIRKAEPYFKTDDLKSEWEKVKRLRQMRNSNKTVNISVSPQRKESPKKLSGSRVPSDERLANERSGSLISDDRKAI